MANLSLLLACSFLAISLFAAVSGYSPTEIKSWCSQTPYPQPCEYHLSGGNTYGIYIKDQQNFVNVAKNLAFQYAKNARDNAYSLCTTCRSGREKAALKTCLELYDIMVQRIYATVDPSVRCSVDDAQTWLSTGLANLETCRDGFADLGITGNILQAVTSHNVSYLITNALAALNKGLTTTNATGYTEGFPDWVRPSDRKLLQLYAPSKADMVVAQDGSVNYKTVTEAVNGVPRRRESRRYVIYVKAGVYKENVEIGDGLMDIMLVGDGIGKTIITGSRSVGGGSTTYDCATVGVVGRGFIAKSITFRNTAGAANEQAVALRSNSDNSVFYQCSFVGYQDTLNVHTERQFYRECDIFGTIDFIFGYATVVIQNCNIYARNPQKGINIITAQGRGEPDMTGGISIHNCKVMAAPDLKGSLGWVKTYLGRPWGEYSRTVFMKSNLDSLIDPAGWTPWNGTFGLNTLYYGEYANTGAGASTAKRVKWRGYHAITSATEASHFTVGNFIDGGSWLPATNVPFTPDL